ncbi:MAG: hypothetical protein ABSB33_06360 [Tepidisphaeraceae bacterium]|jgi:hypothetical protein
MSNSNRKYIVAFFEAFKWIWWFVTMAFLIATQLSGHPTSSTAYRIAATVCFIVTSFLVWLREHKRVLELERVSEPNPIAASQQASLSKKLDRLSAPLKESFFEIAFGGPVTPQSFIGRFNPLAELNSAGLIQYNKQTGQFSVSPENVQAAKAIYPAYIAASNSSNSQT